MVLVQGTLSFSTGCAGQAAQRAPAKKMGDVFQLTVLKVLREVLMETVFHNAMKTSIMMGRLVSALKTST